MTALSQYTVIWVKDGETQWQGFNCMAEDADHAEEQCENAYPGCSVIWVNVGHDNMEME